MESARPARPEDLPVLAELAAAAAARIAEVRGGVLHLQREARPLPALPSLTADLSDPDCLVLAGEFAGAVVGYAVVATERLRDGSRLGVVRDLYVDAQAREVGVGAALMDAVLAWCEARGCVGVDAVALPGDRITKNFFEAHGLVARALVVHRPLGRGVPQPPS